MHAGHDHVFKTLIQQNTSKIIFSDQTGSAACRSGQDLPRVNLQQRMNCFRRQSIRSFPLPNPLSLNPKQSMIRGSNPDVVFIVFDYGIHCTDPGGQSLDGHQGPGVALQQGARHRNP